jgi:hypothetical protein
MTARFLLLPSPIRHPLIDGRTPMLAETGNAAACSGPINLSNRSLAAIDGVLRENPELGEYNQTI